jgi:hypothetical protein
MNERNVLFFKNDCNMFLEQDYEWFLIGPAAAKWHLNVFFVYQLLSSI